MCVQRFRKGQAMRIPSDLDYGSLPMLSAEERAKLEAARPESVHAASRISGLTPSSLMMLYQVGGQAGWVEARRGGEEGVRCFFGALALPTVRVNIVVPLALLTYVCRFQVRCGAAPLKLERRKKTKLIGT
jgi:hypothetical protein